MKNIKDFYQMVKYRKKISLHTLWFMNESNEASTSNLSIDAKAKKENLKLYIRNFY